MNCPDHQTISAFVDGELEAVPAAEVQHHLAACPNCQRFVEDMQWVDSCGRAALRALPVEEAAGVKTAWLGVPWRKRMRPVLLAAAAMVVATLLIWTWLVGSNDIGRQQARHQIAPGSVSAAGGSGHAHASDDAAFEQWAARYRKLEIPLVPMEVAAGYNPTPISAVQPQ